MFTFFDKPPVMASRVVLPHKGGDVEQKSTASRGIGHLLDAIGDWLLG